MIRVVFMGSDAIALPLLDWLAGEGSGLAEVVAIFTQPDRAAGRGQKVQPGALKLWAQARGLPAHQPAKISAEDLAQLQGYRPDLALVMAYGHILRPNFIEAPRLGTLNLHASLLPKFRGASPIPTAIACGERETGVTLMRIVPELDAGPVAAREVVSIGPLDTAAEVEARLSRACVPLLARALPELAGDRLVFVEQDPRRATFSRRLDKPDGQLDFTGPASALAARINGLFPWPACATEFNGQPVRLGGADVLSAATIGPLDYNSTVPGTVLGVDSEGLCVATGQGVLRLRKLQRSGGKMLPAAEFLRGFPVAAGTILPSRAMTTLVSNAPFRRKA